MIWLLRVDRCMGVVPRRGAVALTLLSMMSLLEGEVPLGGRGVAKHLVPLTSKTEVLCSMASLSCYSVKHCFSCCTACICLVSQHVHTCPDLNNYGISACTHVAYIYHMMACDNIEITRLLLPSIC